MKAGLKRPFIDEVHSFEATFVLSPKHIERTTDVRLATDIAHDGFHALQYREERPSRGKEAEREAVDFQLGYGNKLGMSAHDREHLRRYRDHIEEHQQYYDSDPQGTQS